MRLFAPRRHAQDFDIVTNNVEYAENMEDLWEGEPDAPDDIGEGSENMREPLPRPLSRHSTPNAQVTSK
ncbi:hypothetical protein [Streptomyces sp. NPDC057616]|uniref:hypothetical protein n=1 Tax=Streptomyces sp. NPDC057616 TaxID=3346183 RepID=UPI00369F5887